MADFGGENELERYLRALLQTDRVSYDCMWRMISIYNATDDQARQLGQVLLEGHQVRELQLIDLSTLTATSDYQPLLDFIETDPDLREMNIALGIGINNEVTSRFFRAMSRSKFISSLAIQDVQHVPTDALTDLLHGPMPITDLTIYGWGNWVNDHSIQSTLLRNTTVIFRAMKRNTSIRYLRIDLAMDKSCYKELAQVLPFMKGLKQLVCLKWPHALNAKMKKAFRQNGSLVDVYLIDFPPVQLDAWQERYLERNRGIERIMASPGTVPDNLIPLICAAAGETNLELDLIFEIVKAKVHLFQDVLTSNETQNNDTVKCSMCCIM